MNSLQIMMKEITELTTMMETEYPELYQFLDENPMTIPATNHPHIDIVVLREYLESLKGLLRHHLETHKKN
ncbi:hypothetical protein [uncultured Eudoraea sp.]|jgi:hypothetical protein|uniref:hypothetical protein n=1 Tax=uncultured Eudoraea sp. TaxID=1035614 RepID=UPI00261251C3|nr:hypothetical protein [uncultured Eudoraea sp.]